MKKTTVLNVLLNACGALALTILVAFTIFQYQGFTFPPYGLEKGYREFTVFLFEPESREKNARIQKELYHLIENQDDLQMVLSNIELLGLGIYNKTNMPKGNDIVVKEESYLIKPYPKNNQVVINQQQLNVIGVYGKESVYYDEHDYVYDYFSQPYVLGYYSVSSDNNNLINDMIALFHTEGYIVNEITVTTANLLLHLLRNSNYFICFTGCLFIIGDLFVLYYTILSRQRKEIYLHAVLGGRGNRMFFHLSANSLVGIMAGSLLGGTLYRLFFTKQSDLYMKPFILICAGGLFCIVSLIFYTLAFYINKAQVLHRRGRHGKNAAALCM